MLKPWFPGHMRHHGISLTRQFLPSWRPGGHAGVASAEPCLGPDLWADLEPLSFLPHPAPTLHGVKELPEGKGDEVQVQG